MSIRDWWLRRTCQAWLAAAVILHWGWASSGMGADFPLRWRWSNPRPHGNNIYDLAYSPQLGLAVQVTDQGQIYTSSDFNLWTPRTSGTEAYLRSVAFLGAAAPRILVTGESGTVLYADSVDQFLAGTLVDGPTTDWLEGVATSATLAVAVGDRGAIYTTTTGLNWKRQSVPAITQYLRGVAYGAGYFVAVGDSGFIARSPNGTNWTVIASGTTTHFNGVHFGNTRFTIVGEEGLTYTSTTAGQSWQNTPSGAAHALLDANTGNSTRLVAGDQEVRLEEAGLWTDVFTQSNPPPAWSYYSSLGLPNFFLLGGRTGLMAEGFRTESNPFLWGQSDHSFRHWLFDMVYMTNLYVAVGDRATVMTSGNGVDWTVELTPFALTNSIFLGVGGTTNLLVAVGGGGSLMISPNVLTNSSSILTNESGSVLTNTILSTLGIVWHPPPPPPTQHHQRVAFQNSLYVITGDNGFIATSPDGTNWTPRPTPTTQLLSSAAGWPGGFVVTGDNGTILSSPDGISWTSRDASTSDWLYKVRFLNGQLLAVGQNGTIRISSDAITWNNATSGTAAWLTDASFIGDTYFVVGTQGTVLTSPDAFTWTPRGTISLKSLYAAATDGAYLLTAGIEGVILRSPVIPNLTPMSILSYAHIQTTNAIQNLYLFGGQPDQQFTLDRRPNFGAGTWSTGPELEIFESSGTLFYLETFPLLSGPTNEFYQATLLDPP